VQDEGQPLGRRELVQHHQQRGTDRVGHERLLLGLDDDHQRIRQPVLLAQRLLPAPLARVEHVQADAGDDGGQPRAEVVDVVTAGAAGAQPRLLQRVVGLRGRAEHPLRDGAQTGAMGLEALGQQIRLVHRGHILLAAPVMGMRPTKPP
jgi:hypothetical protein